MARRAQSAARRAQGEVGGGVAQMGNERTLTKHRCQQGTDVVKAAGIDRPLPQLSWRQRCVDRRRADGARRSGARGQRAM